ncbi:hypothetical protein ACC740_39045, partial [Rhizobium ruizarguesonis]
NFSADANHAQPGNPARLATGIMTMVNSSNPPLRMPFGSDTLAVIEQQHASVEKELAASCVFLRSHRRCRRIPRSGMR